MTHMKKGKTSSQNQKSKYVIKGKGKGKKIKTSIFKFNSWEFPNPGKDPSGTKVCFPEEKEGLFEIGSSSPPCQTFTR